MSDGVVQVAPDSTGKKIDTSELVVNSQTVERQRIVIGDNSTAAGLAGVANSAPAGTEYGLIVRNLPIASATNFSASTASINATVVKAAAGSLYNIMYQNTTGSTVYIKVYNKATTPAPASDSASLVTSIVVTTNTTSSLNFGPMGHRFSAGISFAITNAISDTDATNITISAGSVRLGFSYI